MHIGLKWCDAFLAMVCVGCATVWTSTVAINQRCDISLFFVFAKYSFLNYFFYTMIRKWMALSNDRAHRLNLQKQIYAIRLTEWNMQSMWIGGKWHWNIHPKFQSTKTSNASLLLVSLDVKMIFYNFLETLRQFNWSDLFSFWLTHIECVCVEKCAYYVNHRDLTDSTDHLCWQSILRVVVVVTSLAFPSQNVMWKSFE